MDLLTSQSDSFGFFAGFLVLLTVVAVVVIAVMKANATHEHLSAVARRLNGRYDSGGFLTRASLQFPLAGRPARFEFYRGSDDSAPYTRLEVTLKSPAPGTLHILPEGFGQSFLKLFGAQDLEVGDARFDADYVIKASPESLAARVFSPDRRDRVMAAVRRLSGFRHPTIDLERDRLRIQVRECTIDEGQLHRMIRTAEEFATSLSAAPAASEPGIQWGELQTRAGGECPVCGTRMDDRVVRCASCRTPHHAECWEYAGKCSTFGCAGRKFVA